MVQPVEFKVRIMIDGKLVEPSDYPKVVIANQTVDRIVNDVYQTSMERNDSPAA